MKNKKLWVILLIAVLVLQVAAEVLTAAIVLRLDMLPDKYTVVLVLVLVLLAALTGVLMFVHGKKPVGTARKIIACVLALLIVCGCALISKVAADAYKTVNHVTNSGVTTNARNMYVFVRKDDPAQSITDAADYTFAIVENYDVKHTEQAIGQIEEDTGNSIEVVRYPMASKLADALLSEEVDALIMNGASVALLIEEEAYEDFTEKIRILRTMPFEQLEEGDTTDPVETDPVEVPKGVTEAPFIVYVSGSDTRSSILDVSRSDVNILMVVNPVTKQVLLLNTPRDYYIPNPAGDGALDKLTHCGLYGVDCSMEALEDLYGVQIGYYGQINFTGFETLVDAVGGVTVYSDQSFKARDTYISVGENYLNGAQALDYARERYNVSGGDNGRGKNQMKVIKAVIQKLTTGTTIISNYSDILESLEGMFSTSFTMEEISSLVKMQLGDMASWNIQSFAVTGNGGHDKPYSQYGLTSYVMYPDEDVVSYASELVERVLSGGTLTEEDMKIPE